MSSEPRVRIYSRKPQDADRAFRYFPNVPRHDVSAIEALGLELERPVGASSAVFVWVHKSSSYCIVHPGDYLVAEPDGSGWYPCTAKDFERTHYLDGDL